MKSKIRRPTLIRVLVLTTGLTLVLAALFANRIGLSHTETMSRGKVLLWGAGLGIFLLGLLLRQNDMLSLENFGKRMRSLYQGIAIITLNTIVLLVFLEAGATLYFRINSDSTTPYQELTFYTAKSARSSYYASQDWAQQYWQEHLLVSETAQGEKYFPYVIWRRAPFSGATININQDGIRLTPGANCRPGSYKVFAFGGSTMWGFGSPDWATIPAYLQSGLSTIVGKPVCTVNFADMGYVSTQELIELLLQLQANNIPDLVVFYDGINDTEVAYEDGRVDRHYWQDRVAAKFEGKDTRPQFIDFVKSSASFHLISSLADKLVPEQRHLVLPENNYLTKGIDANQLSDSVIKVYLNNYSIVETWSQEYGFKYAFFWQPVISIGKKPLTTEEQSFKADMAPEARFTFFDEVYQKLSSTALEHKNLYYIADVFDQQESQIWIDWPHATPVGNQLVAQKMLDLIKRQIGQ
jgi:lysophospholipase L1-like esterase